MNNYQVPGQKKLKSALEEMIRHDRLPHALLLTGNSGLGGLSMAVEIAAALHCDENLGKACGQCKSCSKSYKLIHPDTHFAFPVVKKADKKRDETTSKDFLSLWRGILQEKQYFDHQDWINWIGAENKSLNINTKECNEIIQKLSLKAFEGRYKVQIIWLPEYLGKESNRLLKLIEEPPENTKIILVSASIERLLVTITSRCQIFKLLPVDDRELNEYLNERTRSDSDSISNVVKLADGNCGLALQFLESSSKDFSEDLLNWLRLSYQAGSHPQNIIDWIATMVAQGKDVLELFFMSGLSFFREYHIWLHDQSYEMRIDPNQKGIARKMQQIISYDKIEYITKELDSLVTLMSRNANMKLALLSSSITVGDIMRKK